MKIATKKSKNRKKIILIITIAAIVLIGGYTAYAYTAKLWPFPGDNASSESTSTRGTNSVDYGPPSQEDIDHSQDAKKRAEEEQKQKETTKPSNPTQPSTVNVGVSFADVISGNVEVRAFVPDVIEGDGTCTATLTKGAHKVTRQSKAFIDSTSSQCEPIKINVDDFPEKGTWQLIVSYSSPRNQGQSESIEVNL